MDWLDTLTRFWPHLVAGLDFVAALLASIHALLHKRDSRAATLWLGVIWLLPLLGPILYLALGFNRIRRRALSLGVHKTINRPIPDNLGESQPLGAEHLQMLARVVGRVVAQPLTPGNQIQPLVNGDDAFPAMLATIESAKASISLVTYIFDNDPSGEQFVRALGRAVARGVVGDGFEPIPVRVQAQPHDAQHPDLPQVHPGAAGRLFARQHGGVQQGQNLGAECGMPPEPLQTREDGRQLVPTPQRQANLFAGMIGRSGWCWK